MIVGHNASQISVFTLYIIMFKLNLGNLTPELFLANYWQKKPQVFRQGFADFEDPISADELAGLASDDMVESRLVWQKDGEWNAEFGPFQSYDHLGEKDWSLIVQAVDYWAPPAAKMIEPFRFIPNWRLDDLMVSFASEGGSVGPHIDNYDVFICQGSGKRHWRVGDRGNLKEFAAHEALLHVEPFETIIDVILEPGDILYIPPGFPHEGIGLEPSMSFSVGFRTNSATDMMSGLADYLIDNDLGQQLIEDPHRELAVNPGEINNDDLNLVQNHLQNILDNKNTLSDFAGRYFTTAKHELDIVIPEQDFDIEEILSTLAEQPLFKLGGLRSCYLEESIDDGVFYINGELYNLPPSLIPIIKMFCDKQQIELDDILKWKNDEEFRAFIVKLINQGYWYF